MKPICKNCKYEELDSYLEPCDSCMGGANFTMKYETRTEEVHDGCDGCKHQEKGISDEPCVSCKYCYTDNFEKMGYWDKVTELQKKQTEKGIRTYGQKLEENNAMTAEERLTYLEEELIDALMYIEHLKEVL